MDIHLLVDMDHGCCVNDQIACLEYQYNKNIKLTQEKDWIKVIGTLKKGIDDGMEYIYIDATSIEKMSERGKDTVKN